MSASTVSMFDISADDLYRLGDEVRAASDSYSAALAAQLDRYRDTGVYEDTAGAIADRLTVKLHKGGDGRYEIDVNGVHVGWVIRPSSWDTDTKLWRVFASQAGSFEGKVRAYGSTRAEALDEFFSNVAIRGVVHTFGNPRR